MGRILVIFFVTVIVIIGVNSFVSLCNIGKESERFEINLINTLTAFGKGDQDGSDWMKRTTSVSGISTKWWPAGRMVSSTVPSAEKRTCFMDSGR